MKFCRAIGILIAMVTLTRRAIVRETSVAGRHPGARALAAHSISPKHLLPRLARDQKRIWSFPATAARGDGWKPALAVMSATAALIALDPIDTPWLQQTAFQQTPAIRRLNRILSGRNTALGIAALPVYFFVAGLVRNNSRASYANQTALLAGEAVANAEILAIIMKDVDRRMRPSEVGPNGDFTATWFRTKNRNIDGFGSFPSGHAASAFAVATVFAERYRHHRWVPWAAFGLASVVGLSRFNAKAHFPSDIFFGAALGYSISHWVVVRRQP